MTYLSNLSLKKRTQEAHPLTNYRFVRSDRRKRRASTVNSNYCRFNNFYFAMITIEFSVRGIF